MKKIVYSNRMKRWLSTMLLSLVCVLPALAGGTGNTYYYRATAGISPSGAGKVYVSTTSTNEPTYQGTNHTITGDQYSVGSASVNFYYYAQPNDSYVFDHWAQGSATGTSVGTSTVLTRTETVTSTRSDSRTSFTYYAVFKKQKGLVKVYSSNANGGSVSISNTNNVLGDEVTLTAYPDVANGVVFLGWTHGSGNPIIEGAGASYTFTVSDETKGDYYAIFSEAQEKVFCRIQNKKTGHFLSVYGDAPAGNHQASYNGNNFNDGYVFTNGLKLISADDAQGNPTTVFLRQGTPSGVGTTTNANLTAQNISFTGNWVDTGHPLTFNQVGAGLYTISTTIKLDDNGSDINLDSYLCDEGTDWTVLKTRQSNIAEGENQWYVYILDENTTTGAFGANAKAKFTKDGKYYTTMYTTFPYQLLDGVKAYYLPADIEHYNEDSHSATFQEVTSGKVHENTAVILECTQVQNAAGEATEVTNRLLPLIEEVPEVVAESSNLLKGYVSKNGSTVANDKEYKYVLSFANDKLGFFHSSKATMSPNKAYLQIPEHAAANEIAQRSSFRFGFDEEEEQTPTAIKVTDMTVSDDADAPIYDLQGRRVQHAVKGIYIKNGKKIFVK